MNFNLESCKLHHSFAKTTIFGVDVYMHHFFYSLFSHNIHTMERFAMKSRIPLGTLWVLHIPSCPLRGEGFEAFFSNLSVVFTSFLQHFNDWCVIKANRKQNKRCTSSKLFDYFPPLPLQLIKLHWVRKEKKVIFLLFLFLESCCRGPEAGTANHSCRLSSSLSHSQLYQSGESICWKSIRDVLSFVMVSICRIGDPTWKVLGFCGEPGKSTKRHTQTLGGFILNVWV